MLESLLFILLILISGLFVIIAFIKMLIGFIRKSSSLKKRLNNGICHNLALFYFDCLLPLQADFFEEYNRKFNLYIGDSIYVKMYL